MAKFVFPKTQIFVHETNTFVDTAVSATDPMALTATVSLPANTDQTAKTYTLEVYADDKATGKTVAVTVAAAAETTVKYEAASVAANPTSLGSEGGSTTVNVTFHAPAQG